ncbi:DUF6551 family protein [Oribacterium sp. C9]|uniref:DUF6551 family protein n=1 Tax=Oribacterium sp. C9 TaxID=1943579 RepID=UPI001FA81E61|nr:DUF6551 family protein [Oribacterium sp. C9]
MEDYSKFVPNVHFEQIPIKNLVSNQEYQRNLSRAHIARAAENFDLYQINPVKVSRRDGVNYVFNGQHTIEIIALVSGTRDTPVWCMIYDDLSYQHEADIFANQMKYVKPLNPYEVFVANLEAESDVQLIINQLVESYGMSIGSTPIPGVICAVSTLEYIYTKYGYHVLDHVLKLCIGTWEGEKNSFSANMLRAVAKLVVTYGPLLKDELFKEKLGMISVKQLARTARERRPGSLGLAEALVLEYNGKKKGNTNKLQIKMLYEKETNFYLDDEPPQNDMSSSQDNEPSIDDEYPHDTESLSDCERSDYVSFEEA